MFVNFKFGISMYNIKSGQFSDGWDRLYVAVCDAIKKHLSDIFWGTLRTSYFDDLDDYDMYANLFKKNVGDYVVKLCDACTVDVDWYKATITLPQFDLPLGQLIIGDGDTSKRDLLTINHQYFN